MITVAGRQYGTAVEIALALGPDVTEGYGPHLGTSRPHLAPGRPEGLLPARPSGRRGA